MNLAGIESGDGGQRLFLGVEQDVVRAELHGPFDDDALDVDQVVGDGRAEGDGADQFEPGCRIDRRHVGLGVGGDERFELAAGLVEIRLHVGEPAFGQRGVEELVADPVGDDGGGRGPVDHSGARLVGQGGHPGTGERLVADRGGAAVGRHGVEQRIDVVLGQRGATVDRGDIGVVAAGGRDEGQRQDDGEEAGEGTIEAHEW